MTPVRRKSLVRASALAAGVAAFAAAPWPAWWLSDLLASAAPWVMVLACILAAAVGLTRLRRWALVPLALLGSLLAMVILAPRAPRAGAGPENTITVLVLNAHLGASAGPMQFLRSHPADVAVLLEAPWDLFSTTAEDAGYAWRLALGPQSGGPAVRAIFSRWPGAAVESPFPDRGVFAARIETPHGPVGVVVAHLQSPRTLARWREGNRRAQEAGDLARRLEAAGTPALIAADFNSPPTGWRSRALAGVGFRRARPLGPPGGSFPAWAPAFAGLAIDGVAAGRAFRVASWETLEAPGSDHRAVLVTLTIERRR